MRVAASRRLGALVLLGLAGCAPLRGGPLPPAGSPPALVLGSFVDDYAIGYTVSATDWIQGHDTRYEVVSWHPGARYLIARTPIGDRPGQPQVWLRIDWMELDTPPYTWAFCYSAYEAPSAEAAAAVTVARRETPRTGCNGHPFSRMRPRHE